MVRTKNPIVSCPPEPENMSENELDVAPPEVDSDEETEALKPLQMYFSPGEYAKPFKISAKCYIHKAVALLESHLKDNELKWFTDHPQFSHFFHMHRDPNHKLMGMWMLLLRTTCLEKKREVWFIVNGVPIRYSLKEFAIMSRLHCHEYPNFYENLGSNALVGKQYGLGTKIQYQDVEKKLLSMKKPSDDRLRIVVLYFLCSVIVGKGKTGEKAPSVEKFFLKAVADLELCKTFPWGRYAFDENLKDIFYLLEKCGGVVGPQKVFPSFVIPLEFLAFEAIPVHRDTFCDNVQPKDPLCPRMCKLKFKSSTMKGFPMSGTTKDIQSILTLTDDEKLLLERIMDGECGLNDVDDVIADGWKKRVVDEGRAICFEDLYNQDIANRAIEANTVTETVNIAPRKEKGKVAPKKVAPNNVSIEGLTELVYRLKTVVENGFKNIQEKNEELDRRLKIMEASIQSIQVSGKENEVREKEVETSQDGGHTVSDKENECGAKELETEMDKDKLATVEGGGDKGVEGEGDKGVEGGGDKGVEGGGDKGVEGGGDKGVDELETVDEPSNKKKMPKRKRGKKEEEPSGSGKKIKKNAKKVVYRSPIMTRNKKV